MKFIKGLSREWAAADIIELEVGEVPPVFLNSRETLHLGDGPILSGFDGVGELVQRYYLVQGHHVIIRQKIDVKETKQE